MGKDQIMFASVTASAAFLLTLLFTALLLPFLRRLKMNQPIYTEVLQNHKKKAGTPTMGGLAFVISSFLVMVGVSLWAIFRGDTLPAVSHLPMLWCTYLYALLNALIGFVDDYCKVIVKKENTGLLAYQKFFLQLIAAAIYLVLLTFTGVFTTEIAIPYTNLRFDAGIFAYVIALILCTGMVNSVNLTDGLDGLASSVTAVVTLFLALAAILTENDGALPLPSILFGAMLGFLCFNRHPAKLFMGDTGSLFLGGAVVGTAFLLGKPLMILIAGGMYVLETLSVILQVISAKLVRRGILKKRLFRKAPLHHHFEELRFSETQIVVLFALMSAVFCAGAWFGVI